MCISAASLPHSKKLFLTYHRGFQVSMDQQTEIHKVNQLSLLKTKTKIYTLVHFKPNLGHNGGQYPRPRSTSRCRFNGLRLV